jgi:imidazolonepropionase-like amidohydrolase
MKNSLLFSAIIFGFAASASAQEIPVCVTDATIHAVDQPTFVGTVCWQGGIITDVGTSVVVPAGATSVNGSGLVVTPGLIAVSTGIGVVEIEYEASTVDQSIETLDPVRAAFRVADGYNPLSSLIPIARSGGVTSTLVLPFGGTIAGIGSWVSLGEEPWPAAEAPPESALVLSYDSATADAVGGARGELMLRFRSLFADVQAWMANESGYETAQMRELSVEYVDLPILQRFLEGTLPGWVRANQVSDMRAVLRLAAEHGFSVTIEGGSEAWAMADELAQAQVTVVVQVMDNLPWTFEHLGARSDNAALLHAAGVPVVIAVTDSHNARTLRYHAGNAVRAGLPWDAALAAITHNAAEVSGVGNSVGTLTAGKRADIAIWTGDPFEFSTALQTLFIAGLEPPSGDRQEALFERYR